MLSHALALVAPLMLSRPASPGDAQCRDQELTRLFEVSAFPTYIVLDGEGAVRLEINGTDDQRSLASRLQETLKSMPELQ